MLHRTQIPSPNHSASRAEDQLLVVHTSEGATTFTSLGNFLANPSAQVSYHVGFDDTTATAIGEYVQPPQKSWSAHSANNYGEHGCCCVPSGAAQGWSRQDWLNRPRLLEACGAWLREQSARYGIPLVKIDGAQVAAGVKGVCGHSDCVDAGLGGSHTDPGPNFPWDVVLSGAAPAAPTRSEVQDMFAVQDTDGGIYLAGPGVWIHLNGEEWGAWERFVGPPAAAVNAAQRDMIERNCLSAGAAPWASTLASRLDGNRYAAGDILTSAEAQAYNAAENTEKG